MIPQNDFTLCSSVEDALKDCKPGRTVMVGGFRLSGVPESIIEYARTANHIKDIIIISMGDTGLTLRDYNPSSSIEEIREKTAANLRLGRIVNRGKSLKCRRMLPGESEVPPLFLSSTYIRIIIM